MHQGTRGALRTRAYVDGYNLYYGCLKGSHDKWLDVHALLGRVLDNVPYVLNQACVSYQWQTPAIKYFTAPILKGFANADDSVACQAQYHAALQAHLGADLEIIKGYHDSRRARAHRFEDGKAPRESERVEIWKLEEKQSDVALALHAFSDAIRSEVDQIVVITNDSDFLPAMQMIRRHTQAIVGLVAPIRGDGDTVNRLLEGQSHWTRRHILDEEFAHSQLPSMIRSGGQAIHKPLSWYARPDLLKPVFDEAQRVKGSAGAARKWLNQPCAHLGDRTPIDMCAADDTATELRAYMDDYAKQFG